MLSLKQKKYLEEWFSGKNQVTIAQEIRISRSQPRRWLTSREFCEELEAKRAEIYRAFGPRVLGLVSRTLDKMEAWLDSGDLVKERFAIKTIVSLFTRVGIFTEHLAVKPELERQLGLGVLDLERDDNRVEEKE